MKKAKDQNKSDEMDQPIPQYSQEYLPERITIVRNLFGLQRKEVAEEMKRLGFNITSMTITNYEKGLSTRSIKLDLLFYFLHKGINLRWFLLPDNTKEPMMDTQRKFKTNTDFLEDLLETALKAVKHLK